MLHYLMLLYFNIALYEYCTILIILCCTIFMLHYLLLPYLILSYFINALLFQPNEAPLFNVVAFNVALFDVTLF